MLGSLTNLLELIFIKKTPGLSSKGKKQLVTVYPWITLIFDILSIPVILALIGLNDASVLPPPLLNTQNYLLYILASICLGLSIALSFFSVPYLFKKSIKGWYLLYVSSLFSLIYGVLTLTFIGLFFTTVSIYLQFQIKEFYE